MIIANIEVYIHKCIRGYRCDDIRRKYRFMRINNSALLSTGVNGTDTKCGHEKYMWRLVQKKFASVVG